MSELVSHDGMPEELTPPIPINRKRQSAEVIDFSQASVEYVTGLFMAELRHPSRTALKGQTLAGYIDSEMSSNPNEAPNSLRARLTRIVDGGHAFGDDELYERKLADDEVFRTLINRLLTTKKDSQLRDQRKATLKLAELRATLHDSTEDDDTWRNVIDRLYS